MRIGIFGGTFNPVHIAHLRLAYIVHQSLGLNKIFFVPAFLPPHKNSPTIAPKHRLTMLNLVLINENWAKTSDCELVRKGKSYTVDTLQHFHSIMPNAQINLLLGADSFNNFKLWHKYKKIMDLANIIVIPRNTVNTPPKDNFIQSRITEDLNEIQTSNNNKIFILKFDKLNISSSQIRKSIQKGYSVKYLVPDVVLNYIEKLKLYA